MYKLGEKILTIGQSFVHNDILYPRNWLVKSTESERNSIGITWEADPELVDSVYYWDANTPRELEDRLETKPDGTPIYVQVWNDSANDGVGGMVDSNEQLVHKGLKSTMTAQVKDTAGKLLAQTDWYVTRKVEKDIAIPTDVVAKRDAVRSECDRLETAIAAVTTVEELKSVMEAQNWGE